MNTNLISIGIESTARDAVKEMISRDIKKIIVADNNEPKGILELQKIKKDDLNKHISELPLSRICSVSPKLSLKDAYKFFQKYPALLVVDENKNQKGIVTYTDWAKSRGLF